MSFDIFLQRFQGGEAADGDQASMRRVLTPMLRATSQGSGRIVTSDGQADVYGLDNPATGLMFNHVSGKEIWDLIWLVADNGGLAIMPVGCPTCVTDGELIDHLPPELPPARVVRSGGELAAVIEQC